MSKVCPECGTQGTEKWYYDKLLSDFTERGQLVKRMAAQHAVAAAERDLERIDLVEQMKWMQRKVNKQARVINRLEEKLKKLNKQPYAEEE